MKTGRPHGHPGAEWLRGEGSCSAPSGSGDIGPVRRRTGQAGVDALDSLLNQERAYLVQGLAVLLGNLERRFAISQLDAQLVFGDTEEGGAVGEVDALDDALAAIFDPG